MRRFYRQPAPPPGITADEMRAAFVAHKDGQPKFTRRMAITIGDHFGMTPMEVVRYYEHVALLKRGSADWFRVNGGITRDHIAEVRADRAAEAATAQVSA